MIVKTSMHTPDIIITNGTDMKVNFRFYDEVIQSNVMEKLYIFTCFFRSNNLTIIITNVISIWKESYSPVTESTLMIFEAKSLKNHPRARGHWQTKSVTRFLLPFPF